MANGRGGSAPAPLPTASRAPAGIDTSAPHDTAAAKQALRHSARATRHRAAETADQGTAERLADRILALVADRVGAVAGYVPVRSEIDPRPALARLAALDRPVALPVVLAPDQPLVFRRWHPDQPLVPGAYGIAAPGPDAAPLDPTVLLVPLLAFDRRGYRLGYGGGFYDRTLFSLRSHGPVLAVGVAFAAQEVPAVPAAPFDQPLDGIVTPEETILTPIPDTPSTTAAPRAPADR